MFSHKLVRALSLGKKITKIEARESNSLLAIIGNGNNHQFERSSDIKSELSLLTKSCEEHYGMYDVVSYQIDRIAALDSHIVGDSLHKFNSNSYTVKHIRKSITDKIESELNQEDFSSYRTLLATASINESQNLFIFNDELRDVTYSMVIDGEIARTNLLMRLSGFVDWLDNNNTETWDSTSNSDMKYLFLWFVKSIQVCNGDVITGLNRGLSVLGKNNIGGHFNFLFSDGNNVCAYSNRVNEANLSKKLVYRISRNVHNICSYIIKTGYETPGLGWSDIKNHNLYCFPSQGAMQVYANIDTSQYSDSRFKTGVNWVCLSLLSC